MNRDLAEGNEGVFTPPKQFLCRSHGVVDSGDEICQRVKEVDCTILPNDVTNPYCLKCGMSSHFESLSGCAQGSDRGLRLATMVISVLPPFDKCPMSLYLFTVLQPCCHLQVFVLVVGHTVSIFCKVDMEAFGLFGVVVICGPKQSDR